MRGSTPLSAVHRNWFQPAVTRSGSGSASASMIASSTSSHIWLPKIVEAGNAGSISEPLRKTVVIGANRPWLVGIVEPARRRAASGTRSGSRRSPTPRGMFVKPGAWSSVSEKSKVISEPAIVTSTAIR